MNNDFDIRNQMTEKEQDNALRPLRFDDFAGQSKIVSNLRIFVEAARMRGESLDHVLLFGPPGLGKTTLSNIIANELGVGFKVTSGPVLDKPGDLAGLLTSLEDNDGLFIDEIHRLSPIVEEYLYSAQSDLCRIRLIFGGQIFRRLDGSAHHYGKKPRRHRVKRTRMPHLTCSEKPSDGGDRIKGGHSLLLVDKYYSVLHFSNRVTID